MAVVRSVRRWVVSHPLKSGVIWVLGLLFLVGGYFSIETALELPAQKAVQAQEAPAPWAKPHIERCLVEVKEDVSEAKAEEAVSCVALVIDITNLGHRPTAVLEDNPSAVLKAHLFYGGSQEWLSVLRLGDNRIAPVLRMCFEDGGSTLFDASSSFTNSVKAAIQGKAPSFEHLTPEKCGWYAVQLISQTGTDFLSQFGIKDGKAHRIPSRTFLAVGLRLFDNTLSVERKLVLKEEIPPGQLAWAVLEVGTLGLLSAKIMAAKVVVSAVGAKAVASAGLATGVLKVGMTALVVPTAKVFAFGSLAYYIVTNPVWVTQQFGQVAEFFGASPLVYQIGGWGVIVIGAILVFFWLFGPFFLWLSTRSHRAKPAV